MAADERPFRIANLKVEHDNLVLTAADPDDRTFGERLRELMRDPKWAVGAVVIPILTLAVALLIQSLLQTYSVNVQLRSNDFAARRSTADAISAATAPFLAEMEFFVSPRSRRAAEDDADLQRIYNSTERGWLASAAIVDAQMVALYERGPNSDIVTTWADLKFALREFHRLSSYVEDQTYRSNRYASIEDFLNEYAREGSELVTVEESESSELAIDRSETAVAPRLDACSRADISEDYRQAVVDGRNGQHADGSDRNGLFEEAYKVHLRVFSACRDQLVREVLDAETAIGS